MGSGETAPTMAKVHRLLLGRLGQGSVDAVLLDTPYGFQENADDISRRAGAYFGRNLGVSLDVATWRSSGADALERERALARVREADYVFAGPGSPSYALRVWRDTPLRDVLAAKLDRGGCVTFASAAALTLGVVAVPVYEVYKVGAPPHWLEGLDLLADIGLRAAVIPHYDNAEGGTHDTRFCYLGERRLRVLEPELPDGAFVLGVDEHTACVFDLDSQTVSVLGRGVMTVRRQGMSTTFPAGSTIAIDELRSTAGGHPATAVAGPTPIEPVEPIEPAPPPVSLRSETDRLERAFDDRRGARDIPAAVAAMLELEQVMFDWSADTEADYMEHARAVLRRMMIQMAEGGAHDPRGLISPFVDALVEARDWARAQGSWDVADRLRDRLNAAGVEVCDTPDGTDWILASS
ncbi:MAG: CysS/YqeB C-terminal domain-containing protein [Egibacteraceae bacterium]